MTGTLVEPAGIVITGPSGRGCHNVVLLPAAVPMLAILRVSTRGAAVDFNCIADVHAGRVSDVDGGITLVRGDRQPGVGEAEQVETVGRELRPGRDLHRRKDGLLGRVLGQGPVGDVDVTGAGVVELDEGVRRVGRYRS